MSNRAAELECLDYALRLERDLLEALGYLSSVVEAIETG